MGRSNPPISQAFFQTYIIFMVPIISSFCEGWNEDKRKLRENLTILYQLKAISPTCKNLVSFFEFNFYFGFVSRCQIFFTENCSGNIHLDIFV